MGVASISVIIISALHRCSIYLTVHCMGEAFLSVISEASTFLCSFLKFLLHSKTIVLDAPLHNFSSCCTEHRTKYIVKYIQDLGITDNWQGRKEGARNEESKQELWIGTRSELWKRGHGGT
jgi:hypothetical protein